VCASVHQALDGGEQVERAKRRFALPPHVAGARAFSIPRSSLWSQRAACRLSAKPRAAVGAEVRANCAFTVAISPDVSDGSMGVREKQIVGVQKDQDGMAATGQALLSAAIRYSFK
jgi:hypothetical protein